MVSGSFNVSNNSPGTDTRIVYSESTSSSGNYSNITVTLQAKTSVGTFGDGTWVLRVGGSTYSRSGRFSGCGNWCTVVTVTRNNVPHQSDGSLDNIPVGVESGGIPGTSWTSTAGTENVDFTDFTKVPNAPSGLSDSGGVREISGSWSPASTPSGLPILEYRYRYSTNTSYTNGLTLSTGTSRSFTKSVNEDGTVYYWSVSARNADGWGPWSGNASVRTLPGAPSRPTVSSITPTSATISWSTPGGSSQLTGYDYQVSRNSTFSNIVATVSVGKVNSDNTADDMTLTPNTPYWVRVRPKVGSQVGDWSASQSFTTLPSSPPSLTVLPAPNGTTSTVTLSPPSGLSSVDSYTVEMRLQGTTTPVTTRTTTGNSVTFTSLTPGAIYEYRVSADIGTYTSPFSAWVARRQPQPSTNPGDYFDGDSPDTENETFTWTGSVNNSTSQVTGRGVLGWDAGPLSGGGSAVLNQVVGGYVGDYAARMLIRTASGGVRFRAGPGIGSDINHLSDVVANETYYGSIYVNPSRDQRISAEINWYTGAPAIISRDSNEGVLCPAGKWTRLTASGQAPGNAIYATVRAIDVDGAGWVAWEPGEYLLLDAAMLTLQDLFPYFDGDTADSDDYTYSWDSASNNSESERSIVALSTTPIIRDPDCPPLPAAPRPPAIDSDCIAETGTWRRYWTIIPSWEVSDMLHTLPAIRVTTRSAALRQLRVRFYQAPQGEDDPNAIDPGDWVSEMVVSYVPPNSVLTLDSVEQRATISKGSSLPAEAGHLLYGSNGAPVVWPVLHCGVNYFVSFETPTSVPIGNQVFEAILTQKY